MALPEPLRCSLPVLAAAALALASATAPGQWNREVPRAKAPPAIDGALAPGEWEGAALVEDFVQVEPVAGAKPSERTVLRLLCDADHLYIGLECFDSDPSGIVGTLRNFDADLDPNDRVEIVIDTFLDRRNAYFFQIGAGGCKGDALVGNNGAFFAKDWDGIWDGRATIHEAGWSAEIAIPAKTLGMSAEHPAFGFNLERTIKRKNEDVRWASPVREKSLFSIASAGTLTGLDGLDKGAGIDFKPYLALTGGRDHRDDRNEGDIDPGFDLRWRVTPGLTATLTVNTDFAETEVDDRIVNLDRFPVFFPEKRDFFLEDASVFSFGGTGGFRGPSGDPLPFFSRRIGLADDGSPVPILGGAKLTGRTGDWNLGFLDVVTDEAAGLDVKNLAAARVAYNLLEESQAGLILTQGDPRTGGDNTLGGLDFSYRTSRFAGGKILRVDAYALGTFDEPADGAAEEEETGYAYGLRAQHPGDEIVADLAWRETSADFRPDLGFAPRRGVRRVFGDFEWRPRVGGGIRRFAFGVNPDLFLAIDDGEIDTLEVDVKLLEVQLESEDAFGIEVTPSIERLSEAFEIDDGVVLPEGRYAFERFRVFAETSNARPVSGEAAFETGGFFSGRSDAFDADVVLRPDPAWSLGLGFERNDVRLPEGDFATNLARARLGIDFSPDLSWRTIVQYDDVSEELGLNSRLRWIVEPGTELFLVFNRGFTATDDDRGFRVSPVTSELTIKLAVTFRF